MLLPKLDSIYADVSHQITDFINGFKIKEESRIEYNLQEFSSDWAREKDLDWELMLSKLLDNVSDAINQIESKIQSKYKTIESKSFFNIEDFNPFVEHESFPRNYLVSTGEVFLVTSITDYHELKEFSEDLKWLLTLRNNIQSGISFYLENENSPPYKEHKRKKSKIPFNGNQNTLIAFFHLLAENHVFHVKTTAKSLKDRFKDELESEEISKLDQRLIDKRELFDILLENFWLMYPEKNKLVIREADYNQSVNKFYGRTLSELSQEEKKHLKRIFESLAHRLGEYIDESSRRKMGSGSTKST